ncbi:phosphoribosylanthranilate isomerase [Pontibacter sp. JAM-7]|uniref:phosphoribosylanthranilate isomerase n=1 Tax=Pontibacter sp. JAM-7 TaxID=3366581 RepID=UPI003AF9A5B3
MRTRIKICGITRLEDAYAAIDAGADALGFVFYPPSPRYIEPCKAAAIISQLPAFVTTTGLFVDEQASLIDQIIMETRIGLIQFHGKETADFCGGFSKPYIKAMRMKPGLDIAAAANQFSAAQNLLLDAYQPGVPGGTGEVFDWQRIPADLAAKVILAGGLDCDNVADAILTVQPYAVDVSGGVEQGKGIKDAAKITAFVKEVNRADSNRS